MSAGEFFIRGLYIADGGTVHRIKVQPETVAPEAPFNPNGTGAVTGVGSARVGGGNRQIGLKARSVTLQWADAPPNNYKDASVRVPILTPAAYNALVLGATVTYLKVEAVVTGKNPERVR